MTRRTAPAQPPGSTAWYGKVPARGDFVGHGFSPAQIKAWDGWLQHALKSAAKRWPPAELDQRLGAFPTWRFFVWPGSMAGAAGTGRAAVPTAPWAGVLVASRDRVGRAFPLTVAELLDAERLPELGWLDIEAALARMADVALDAIETADVQAGEDFEAVLRSLGSVFTPARVAARAALRVEAPPGAPALPAAQSPLDLLRHSPGTQSLWWSEPAPGALPLPLGDAWPPHADLLLDILHRPDDPG
jgi:type VI secretion system protein ImpM